MVYLLKSAMKKKNLSNGLVGIGLGMEVPMDRVVMNGHYKKVRVEIHF